MCNCNAALVECKHRNWFLDGSCGQTLPFHYQDALYVQQSKKRADVEQINIFYDPILWLHDIGKRFNGILKCRTIKIYRSGFFEDENVIVKFLFLGTLHWIYAPGKIQESQDGSCNAYMIHLIF